MADETALKKTIPVQVCYAEANRQIILDIEVPEKTTLIQAIEKSGIANLIPHQIGEKEVGIHGKKRDVDAKLKAYDRIEIYRPLRITPQESRRLRAALTPPEAAKND